MKEKPNSQTKQTSRIPSVGVELTQDQVNRIIGLLALCDERDERLDNKLASALVRIEALKRRKKEVTKGRYE